MYNLCTAVILYLIVFVYFIIIVFFFYFIFLICSDLVFVWSKLYCRLKTSKKALLEEIHQLMLSSTNVNSIFPFIRAVLQEVRQKFNIKNLNVFVQMFVFLCIKLDSYHVPF